MSIESTATNLTDTSQPAIICAPKILWEQTRDKIILTHEATPSDIIEFVPDEGVKVLREKISGLSLKPHSSQFRILFINAADELNQEEANTLLKVLEEPPEYGRIYLLARNISKILPTVRSRCLKVFLAHNKLSGETILPIMQSRDFNSFENKLKDLDFGQLPNLIESALEQLVASGINESNIKLYRKLIEALNIISSTNASRKLILEQIYISLKSEKH